MDKTEAMNKAEELLSCHKDYPWCVSENGEPTGEHYQGDGCPASYRKAFAAALLSVDEQAEKRGAITEMHIWSDLILADDLTRAEWEKHRGDRTNFSADDAAMLIGCLIEERDEAEKRGYVKGVEAAATACENSESLESLHSDWGEACIVCAKAIRALLTEPVG